ncbi:hypothetical protein TNCV_4993651 [Trichonephila clavipes]|nr:hypothetical protein TNCV_4993651 [Trichonephila clavipes]
MGMAKSATSTALLNKSSFVMHLKSRTNQSFKDLQRIRVLKWNAGGISDGKRTQLWNCNYFMSGLHPNGLGTNSDLTLASADISDRNGQDYSQDDTQAGTFFS